MNKKCLLIFTLVIFTIHSVQRLSEEAQHALMLVTTNDQDFIFSEDKEAILNYNWRLPDLKEEADVFWVALANNDKKGAHEALNALIELTTGAYTIADWQGAIERENIINLMTVSLLRYEGKYEDAVAVRESFEEFKELFPSF